MRNAGRFRVYVLRSKCRLSKPTIDVGGLLDQTKLSAMLDTAWAYRGAGKLDEFIDKQCNEQSGNRPAYRLRVQKFHVILFQNREHPVSAIVRLWPIVSVRTSPTPTRRDHIA